MTTELGNEALSTYNQSNRERSTLESVGRTVVTIKNPKVGLAIEAGGTIDPVGSSSDRRLAHGRGAWYLYIVHDESSKAPEPPTAAGLSERTHSTAFLRINQPGSIRRNSALAHGEARSHVRVLRSRV